jgi:hypothetical protein
VRARVRAGGRAGAEKPRRALRGRSRGGGRWSTAVIFRKDGSDGRGHATAEAPLIHAAALPVGD